MFNLRLLSGLLFMALASCGTVQNKYQIENDDVYYSRKQSNDKTIITPDVDVNKIMQQYPSKIKEGTFDNRPTEVNPNSAQAYAKYRADTDSLYKKNPQLASNYNPYKAPVFDEREEARRLRRLNRMYNNNYRYSRNNYGYNNGFNNYGYSGFNNYGYNRWSSFLPSLSFGWNSYNGFNYGVGYGNGWGGGYNNYYNPWNNYGYNNYYSPYNSWGYSPYYGGYGSYYGGYYPYYQPVIIDNKPSTPTPPNRPRIMAGSDVPPLNNGNSATPATPRTGQISERQTINNSDVNTNVSRQVDNGTATLKRDEVGNYQYTPPSNYNRATGATEQPVDNRTYSGYTRDNNVSNTPSFRNDNNVMPSEQRNNSNNYQQEQPNNNRQPYQQEQNYSRPSYSSPSYSAPSVPRNSGGNGGTNNGASGSRPR